MFSNAVKGASWSDEDEFGYRKTSIGASRLIGDVALRENGIASYATVEVYSNKVDNPSFFAELKDLINYAQDRGEEKRKREALPKPKTIEELTAGF